jgi:hypothetical protein
MEYTFLASYIVMLIGFLIMESQDYQSSVRQFLRGNNFTDMVELLKKFFNFMNLTASVCSFCYIFYPLTYIIPFADGSLECLRYKSNGKSDQVFRRMRQSFTSRKTKLH